jgi:hypothetical protein
MLTPPKDKPVYKDEDVSSEQDDLQNDEAVASQDTEVISDDNDKEDNSSESSADLNIDTTDVGLNEKQGEEFL